MIQLTPHVRSREAKRKDCLQLALWTSGANRLLSGPRRKRYVGFFFDTGFFFRLFARHQARFRHGLIAQASIFGGFALGRTVNITMEGALNPFIATLCVGEMVGLAVALVLLRQVTRGNGA